MSRHVGAAIRIALRAIRLQIPKDEPMAVFVNADGKRLFISDYMVTKYLRLATSKVLNIAKGSKELQLWSTHSIRVTAADILHRQKFADSFIQVCLRWHSLTFRDYLRNAFYSADQHGDLKISKSNLPLVAHRTYCPDEPHEGIIMGAGRGLNSMSLCRQM
ncbi:hypothetical protein ACHAWF_002718, partial [Thalassiosira exigua]